MVMPGPVTMGSFRQDPTITQHRLKHGILRRIARYLRPYRVILVLLLLVTAVDAAITVVNPLLLRMIIDRGIIPRDEAAVIGVALAAAAVAVFGAMVNFAIRWFSTLIGEGLIYDLRTEVFTHVQKQPLAFFTRAQTGSLVSRLNSDVIGAEQAVTSVLSSVVSNVLAIVAILITMFYLSWLITLIGLVLIPVFILPATLFGRRLQRLTREAMQQNAKLGSMMTERFNVAGAMLVKLFGRPREESEAFARGARRVRDIHVSQALFGQAFFIALLLLASLTSAAVYGAGGVLVVHRTFQLGTLVALAALLASLYGPVTQMSGVQMSVMNALVSFDRVFEVLDLTPLIADRPGAVTLARAADDAGTAPEIVFDRVCFRYPTASEVSLASLESIAPRPEAQANQTPRPQAQANPTPRVPERGGNAADVLHHVSFRAPAGTLTALVGPSGAGKTTITHLAARLYDPISGSVRIGGRDLRDVTLESLHDVVGVVSQDAHMFHDTIRANLAYARPGASELELIDACEAAQIWELISSLPDGLDTVVGDRGYRLSGGEKQRTALARLLLKAPSVVVLDEATAHLDAESEAAVQRALRTALAGRTSLVIAHRLSTIRQADQILVIAAGQVAQAGTHEALLAAGGLYADLYHAQFAGQRA